MRSITNTTIVITVFSFLGILLGFLSNVIIASIFGAGTEMDVYLAATALPLFITSILSGVLNVTFIPVFNEYKKSDSGETWKIVSTFLNLSALFTIVVTIAIILYSNPIVKILMPGFSNEKLSLASSLIRWQIPIIIFTVINELLAAIYFANSLFITPMLNKIIAPVISILYVVLLHKYLSIHSLVIASVTGMTIQTGILFYGFSKNKQFHYLFVFDYKNRGVMKVYKLMLPLIVSMLFCRVIPLFDRYIASGMPAGNISYLGYAYKIYSQLPSIISTGIALSLFPIMASLASKNNLNELKLKMSEGIRMIFFISIPITMVFCIHSRYIIQAIFQRGAFTSSDTIYTSQALAFYVLALPVATMGDIISKGYYVLQDTMTPSIISMVEIILYIIVALLLLPYFGFLAIPISYAVYFNFSLINAYIVRKKLGGTGGNAIIASLLKHTGISLFSAISILPLIFMFDSIWIKLFLILGSFILYFLLSYFVLKSPESFRIWNVLLNWFKTKKY